MRQGQTASRMSKVGCAVRLLFSGFSERDWRMVSKMQYSRNTLIDKKIDCPTVRVILAVDRFEWKSLTLLDPPANRLPPREKNKILPCQTMKVNLPVTIMEFAAISKLCMTAMGRRLGPKRAKDRKNFWRRGVLGGKRGSSHESCEAELVFCHEMRNRYVHRTSVKYPSAVILKKKKKHKLIP